MLCKDDTGPHIEHRDSLVMISIIESSYILHFLIGPMARRTKSKHSKKLQISIHFRALIIRPCNELNYFLEVYLVK